MQGRHRCDHASVAFVRDDAQGSGFGHAKVHPADAHIRRQENLAQNFASRIRERGDIFGIGDAEFLVKEFSHLVTAQMHGGRDDVGGFFAAQLDNVFAEVGLDHAVSRRLERVVELDLLADHGF